MNKCNALGELGFNLVKFLTLRCRPFRVCVSATFVGSHRNDSTNLLPPRAQPLFSPRRISVTFPTIGQRTTNGSSWHGARVK